MNKFELLEKLTDVMDCDTLLTEVINALSTDCAIEILHFIANNHDVDL